ncbi:hypothetical protein NUU27_25395, partial [Nitratireductor sp. ZSWI3]|nr:hypothetical protein [Nitratireductor sp. ZSWI3]
MILWPDLSRRPPAEAEPVASPLEAGPTAPLPPPLDTPERTVAEDTAPAIPAAPVRSAPQRRNAVVGGLLLLTFGVSALAHGAIIAFLAERLKVEGMETATDAVSVEIIFEAPPKPPAEPIPGEETALLESVPDPVTPPAQAETDSEPEAKPQEALENKALPTVPDSTQEALPASEPEPSRPADAPTAEPVPAAPEFIELPRQTAAVPSPRPAPPVRTAARPP